MSALASQITGVSIVYSTVCLGTDQGKYQNSASLAFWREFTGDRFTSPHKGSVTRKMFPYVDVIVVSTSLTNHFGPRMYTASVLDRASRNIILYRLTFLSDAGFRATCSIHEMKLTNKEQGTLRERKPPPYLIWGAWKSLVKHETI